MRALIGLEPRAARFCRGPETRYDPAALGLALVAPDGDSCPAGTPFLFDTAQPGNSNAGHVYPKPGSVGKDDLEALIAYLGTL
jgi:hypothetical protein